MILLLLSGLVGSVATAALLWQSLGPIAVLLAPLGGSISTFLVGGYLAWRWPAVHKKPSRTLIYLNR
jgi:hypothetical protein